MAQTLKKNHAKLFNVLAKTLSSRTFFQQYLFDKKHFTRDRQLSFKTVVLLVLRLLKSSIRTELKSFHSQVFNTDEVVNWVSSAALCKARQKIKYELFSELGKLMADLFYRCEKGSGWKGFRLLGVDGSEINLPPSKELLDKFGHQHTSSVGAKIPQARISFLSDVLNKITIEALIEPFKVAEQTMFIEHLKILKPTDLLTADAGYGHFWIIKEVIKAGADFCFRMSRSSNFIKDFLASGEKDIVLEWSPSRHTRGTCRRRGVELSPIRIRLVRIELGNEVEILATSLLEQQKYLYDDIKELYNKRWATEEEFKKFMHRLRIEFFSSVKTNGVLQDFYANVFMLNLVSFLTHGTNKKIFEISKDFKYRRQINWTSAMGDIRQKFVLLFLRSVKCTERIIKSLRLSFIANTESIKPGRKFMRTKHKQVARKKYFMCYKPAW